MSKPVKRKFFDEDKVFWDRLVEMPDIEAELELIGRRDGLLLENAMLSTEKREAKNRFVESDIGIAIQENASLVAKINDELKIIRERMNRLSWKAAVKAVFGDEGYLQCVIWIETHGGARNYALPYAVGDAISLASWQTPIAQYECPLRHSCCLALPPLRC